MSRSAFCLFVLLFVIGCGRIPMPVASNDILDDTIQQIKPVVINDQGTEAIEQSENDPYTLEQATLKGDTLTLIVSYSGGCQTHVFTLIAADVFMESYPVQLQTSLAHNANLDMCEMWITAPYHFDLTPIKTMYQQAYKTDTGPIVLKLNGLPDDASELIYAF